MNEAFGSASRMLRASLPACVRCASSEMTMMSSRSLYGSITVLVELVNQAEDEAMILAFEELLKLRARSCSVGSFRP